MVPLEQRLVVISPFVVGIFVLALQLLHMGTFRRNRCFGSFRPFLLGSFGIHKFYLGKIGMGILYIVFCWSYIPAIVGFIEGIIYLSMNDEDFDMKYNR